jgi:hypothetical protein
MGHDYQLYLDAVVPCGCTLLPEERPVSGPTALSRATTLVLTPSASSLAAMPVFLEDRFTNLSQEKWLI